MTDFEKISGSVLGYLTPECRVPWAQDITREGTPYSRAYQTIEDARERLCRRFAMAPEDGDLEAVMNALQSLERSVAQGIFDAAIRYAENGYQL